MRDILLHLMPFGLKNAGATYQRAATTIFHDMIHKEVEVYVDDMIIKSKEREGHVPALWAFFDQLRQYQMRLNPHKCVFGITKGKLLGYVVNQKGIEVDPAKVQAIRDMPEPRTEKEVRDFWIIYNTSTGSSINLLRLANPSSNS